MTVLAVTRIEHGEGGEVRVYEVGDEVDLNEDQQRSLVESGAAVEVGRNRKFSQAPAPLTPEDEATKKRDELIAKSLMGTADTTDDSENRTLPSPAAQGGSGVPSAEVGGTKTVQQVASEKQNRGR